MKLTNRDRTLLAVVAALLACAAFYVFVFTPERHTAARLQTEIADARGTLTRAQQRELVGHAAEVALRGTQGDWVAGLRAVPNVSNVPALLKLLAHSANLAHVKMDSITMTGASAGSTSTASTTPAPAGATTIPVSLTFEGGYQALNRLVARLDSLVTVSRRSIHAHGPLIGFSTVAVNPKQNTVQTGPNKPLTIQLTAAIYQHSPASTVEATSTGSAG